MILLSLTGYVPSERISAAPDSSNLPQPLLISGLSALFDWRANLVAPFGPGAIVIAYVIEPEEIRQHKPGVARSVAYPAIDHRVGVRLDATLIEVNFRQLGCGLESGVIVRSRFPRHALCFGNVTTAQHTLLRIL